MPEPGRKVEVHPEPDNVFSEQQRVADVRAIAMTNHMLENSADRRYISNSENGADVGNVVEVIYVPSDRLGGVDRHLSLRHWSRWTPGRPCQFASERPEGRPQWWPRQAR